MGTVIVGNGMAGSRLVGELRSRDRRMPITVFGAEAARPRRPATTEPQRRLNGSADADWKHF